MKRPRLRPILFFVSLLAGASCAASGEHSSESDPVQAYVDGLRADLSEGKVQVLTGAMALDAKQASIFWPIYQEYETELFELGDRRMEAIRRFVVAEHAGTLDDAKAGQLVGEFFATESDRLELLKKYHEILGRELSPLRAAQFVQIEHRIATVIDLLVASQLPLVGAGPRLAEPAAVRRP